MDISMLPKLLTDFLFASVFLILYVNERNERIKTQLKLETALTERAAETAKLMALLAARTTLDASA